MKRLLLLLLIFPWFALAQSDPLASVYLPSIDKTCTDYPANVWVTDTMTKIRQDAGTFPTCTNGAGNNIGKWGTFYGTQGEFIDFQVHWHDTGSGTTGLNITVGGFSQAAPNTTTPISAPSSSYSGTLVYREAYYDVVNLTNAAAPAFFNATGFYPDPLIPTIDPYYHQTTNAWPVTVTANQNQSAWIDVFIPLTAASGYYLGSVTVQTGCSSTLTGCTTVATLPVILAVWQWPSSQGSHMPTTASLPSEMQYGGNDFCLEVYTGSGIFTQPGCNTSPITYPNGQNGTDVDGSAMMLDHRWSMADPVNGGGPPATAWTPLFGGTTGINVSTLIPGARSTGVRGVGPSTLTSPITQAWDTYVLSTNRPAWPQLVNYDYTANEPGTNASTWTALCANANSDHALTFPMSTLITNPISVMNFEASAPTCSTMTGGIQNSVDIMVVGDTCFEPAAQFICNSGEGNNGWPPTEGLQLSQYTSWLSHTSPYGITPQVWSYIACGNGGTCNNGTSGSTYPFGYSNYDIDSYPAANRAAEWITWLHGQTGILYYFSTCAFEGGNGCALPNTVHQDPWINGMYQFGNNGDGTLFYTSTYNCGSYYTCGSPFPTNHVTQQNGTALTTPIWISSVRMKHMRDGMQDYEYLHALTTAGKGSYVMQQVASPSAPSYTNLVGQSVAPGVGWITNSYTYEFSGTGLTTARTNLGTTLHQLTFPANSFPPSGCAIQGSGPNWSCAAGAATSDVTGAIAGAPDGAVVTFQLGSYTVTGPQDVSLTKGITFICQTAPNGIGAATGATGCNITVNSGYFFGRAAWPGSGQYFTKLYRVSGFNFVSWPTNTRPIFFGSGAVAVNEGVFTNLRIDHNTFQTTAAQAPCNPTPCQDDIAFIQSGHRSYFYGAVDHNLQLAAVSSHFLFGSNAQMDPFTPPNPLGTGNTLTLEDNTLTTTSETNPGEGVLDWDYGLQPIVFRHNTVTDSDLTTHYTVTGFEVYNNQFIKDAGSPNPDCYRAVHLQTTALSEDFNNQFTCSGGSGQPVVLSLGTIREGYKVDPRLWPTTLKPTGFVSHPPFTDGNRPPSQTNQGYPYLYQPTRDIATGALTPYYAWNNTINGPTFHAISVEDFGFVQVPDYYTNHLQPNRDFYQSVVGAQTSTTSPWNCSTTPGMGWGPITNQPSAASCPAYTGEVGGGYGYAAQTTAGTIGSSASGTASDTVLYQLGASGWKQIYKPYPYPHPLVAGTAQAAFPAFSLAPGAYQGTQNVSLSCSSPSPTIYYTTDGTAPTHSSNVFSSALSVATTETINAICVSSGLLDSLTLSGGYFINATAFNAWPTQPGTYPAGTQAIQISNPGQNVQICATDDGSTPTSSGANNGLCGHFHYTNPILIGGINQFVKFACTATCTVAFMTTGVNLADSPVTTVHYTLGGSNGLWWEDIGGADATITNFAIGGTAVVNNFGSQPIGVQSGTLPIYLNNIGSISTISGGLPSTQPTQSTVINSVAITGSSAFTRANVTGTGGECGAVPITINAGSYCNLQFVFNPTVAGPATATVSIADNTAGTTHTITLTGTGGASATLTPSPLAFGNQNINTTSAAQFSTLTNTSSVTLNINAISVTGNFSNSGTGTCGATLAAGASCFIGLTFSPTATISYSGTLSVTDSAPNSPQTINLTGQGTQATIAWTSSQGGTTYNYGSIVIGVATQSAQQTLTNTGTGPLTVALSITGANAAQFNTPAPTSNCPGSLPAGQSCQVVVTFNPNSAANFTAFLTETDALASNSPQNLTLNGTGVTIGPIVAPSPTMIISQNRSSKNETDSAFGSNVAYLRRRGFGANPPGGSFLGSVSHYWGYGL